MANTAAAFLATLAKEVGYREGRDPNGNWNNLTKYGIWYAEQVKDPAFRNAAWCDMFLSWGAAMSGCGDIIPLSAWVPGRLAYYRNRKQTGYFPPQPGDLGIVFSNGSAVHVFAVEKWRADIGKVQTLEGNTNDSGSPQGNGVYRLLRSDWSTNPNIIYCRPKYATVAPTPPPPPADTRKGTTSSLSLRPNPALIGDLVELAADTSPGVAGTHTYEWSRDGQTWFKFGEVATTNGSSRHQWRFGGTHPVRVRFTPKDSTAYKPSTSSNVQVTSYGLQSIVDRLTALEKK